MAGKVKKDTSLPTIRCSEAFRTRLAEVAADLDVSVGQFVREAIRAYIDRVQAPAARTKGGG